VKKNLVLLGMMAVGKTTLSKNVTKKQELEFIDIGASIEKKNSMTIKEIFKKKGEKFFRMEEEKEVLKSLKKNNCIITLGGGAFMNKTIRENILKNTISIWLDVDIKTLNKRVQWNKKRPLLKEGNNKKKLTELYAERKGIYKLANHKIACDKLSKENITEKIIALYEKY
jgi:shikimate kinase